MQYENRLVAFLDILGFSEIVKASENDEAQLQLLKEILQYLKTWEAPEKWDLKLVEIEEDAEKKGIENFEIAGKTNTTTFSDSILISVRVDNDLINEATSTLISKLSFIGTFLLEKGILFRGAMTVGNLIHEESGIVFGQALIDAYRLESTYAKYPRIILTDKLIQLLNYPYSTKRNRYPYHQYIERFNDGFAGFHQLTFYQVMDSWREFSVTSKERLEKVRKAIIDGLDSSFQKPDVFDKYLWLKESYNNLIILSDYDFTTKTDENVKIKIRELNEGIPGNNIHYRYTDEAHEQSRKKRE